MGTGYWPLIASHACTKLGSKAWEFATPLLLLQFSDGTLLAPTLFGLCVFLFKFVFGPAAGRWMDCTARWRVVIMGLLLQAIGVLGALGVLWLLWTLCPPGQATQMPWVLLGAMIACGAAEALGALVSSVAVKKDWVPSIWAPTDPDLASVNTAMANIDLVAEIFGPLAAGTAMQLLGQSSGFVLVGAVNVVSFGVELLLLRAVYVSNAQLAAPKPSMANVASGDSGRLGELLAAWPAFLSHPSGIPLLVIAYALLYFTVLSPHGVVLTAYLQTVGLMPPALAAFRAAGALAGVAGMAAFRLLSSKFGLRPIASAHLWLLALAVLAAAASFAATERSLSRREEKLEDSLPFGLSPPMIAFLALVVVSRFGLYGFDLAVLQLQQLHVDEALRGQVGSVESSLCSLGTASLFVATLCTSTTSEGSFDVLVYCSAGFVSSAALVYTIWVLCYHEHAHEHPLFDGRGPVHHQHHHTTQQLRALDDSADRTHVHLHFHPPWSSLALKHLKVPLLGEGHTHAHPHAHPASEA